MNFFLKSLAKPEKYQKNKRFFFHPTQEKPQGKINCDVGENYKQQKFVLFGFLTYAIVKLKVFFAFRLRKPYVLWIISSLIGFKLGTICNEFSKEQ